MKSFGWYIAAFFIIVLFFEKQCERIELNQSEKTVKDTYDKNVYTVFFPIPAVLKNTVYKAVPKDVDTAKILRDHFSERTFVSKIDDGRIRATIVDTVYKNTLIGRSFSYQSLLPVKQETAIVSRRGGLYLGVQAGGNKDSITTIAPSVLLVTKRRGAYSLHYNLLDKSFQVGAYWKFICK